MIPLLGSMDTLTLQFTAQYYSLPGYLLALTVSMLGNPLLWFFITAYLYWKGNRSEAFNAMLLVLSASVAVGAMKSYFMRPRPSSQALTKLPSSIAKAAESFTRYSFPSGHSAIITSLYAYFRRQLEKRWKAALLLIALGVCISRLYLQAHYLSDVIAGILLGLLLGEAVFRTEKRFGKKLHSLEYPHGKAGFATILAVLGGALWLQLPILALPPLGFFLGHFYSEHKKKHKEGFEWKKETVGFGCLAAISATALFTPSPIQEALFFTAGLWITLLYPRLYNRFLKKARRN